MKKTAKAAAILAAMVLAAGLTACQKKDGAEASGAAQKSAGTAKAAKPTPVNEFSRELTEDSSGVKILKYTGSAKNVVIPSEIEGLPVKIIDEFAFESNKTMKSVIIPDSVEEIGGGAFWNCTALERVTLGNSVQKIDSIYFDDSASGAFQGCTALKSITIPDSVKEIGACAFNGCTALQSLTIPDSLQKIEFRKNWSVFSGTELPLATQARLKALGYTEGF